MGKKTTYVYEVKKGDPLSDLLSGPVKELKAIIEKKDC